MEEQSAIYLEDERAKLLSSVARFLEAADQRNRELTAVEDAAIMEIVKEAQHLEMANTGWARHKKDDDQPRHGLIDGAEKRRIELLNQIAQILIAGELSRKQEAEVTQKIKEAQDLEVKVTAWNGRM